MILTSDYKFISNNHNLIPILIFISIINVVKGSIHDYKNEGFIPRFNSYFFHGGSEGMYASMVHINGSTEDKLINGKSFIRYKLFFTFF